MSDADTLRVIKHLIEGLVELCALESLDPLAVILQEAVDVCDTYHWQPSGSYKRVQENI